MAEIVKTIVEWLQSIIVSNNIFVSLLVAFLIVILESILPFLPLAVFIAINKMVFGNIIGFFLSWSGTIIGCIIAFTIFSKFIARIDIGIAILKLFCMHQRAEQTAWVCGYHWQLGFSLLEKGNTNMEQRKKGRSPQCQTGI